MASNSSPCSCSRLVRLRIALGAFAIAPDPVSAGKWAEFVADGAVTTGRSWSEAGWAWRLAERARPRCTGSATARGAGWRAPSTGSRRPTRSGRLPRERPRGRRLRALGGLPPAHRGRVGARRRRARPRRRRPTSTSWPSAPRRAAPTRPCAERLPRRCSATSGSGPRRDFAGYPGFRAFPYREYSEVFFGDGYRVLRGGSWATQPIAARTSFRNWDLPERRQIFSGLRLARDPVTTPRAAAVPPRRPPGPDAGAGAGRRRPRGPDRRAQVAAAEVVLRRARLRALRAHHPPARVLPDPHRAGDPETARRRHRAPHRADDARRARLGHLARRRGCCSTRFARRAAPCAASCRSTSARGVLRRRGGALRGEYPGLDVHGVVGDFDTTSARCPARRTAAGRVPGRHDRQPRAGAARAVPAPAGATCSARRLALLGTDLAKDPRAPGAAYDDAAGVTAQFNNNVLRVLNRELDADFDLDAFDHVRCYDRGRGGSRCACAPRAPTR